MPNNLSQVRPKNRNLVGATVNAPGAELANSSHSHECLVACRECVMVTCSQALDQAVTSQAKGIIEDEKELDLNSKPKKQNQKKRTAVAAGGTTACSATLKSFGYGYMFLLDRLYQSHNKHFTEKKYHEHNGCVMHALCVACALCPSCHNVLLQLPDACAIYFATGLQ
jgi:hypothetical protein